MAHHWYNAFNVCLDELNRFSEEAAERAVDIATKQTDGIGEEHVTDLNIISVIITGVTELISYCENAGAKT